VGDSEEWWSRTGSREIAMCHEVIGGLVSPRWRREAGRRGKERERTPLI
jgi:hypothetical protein